LVPYERLLTQKTDELNRIAKYLGVSITEASRRRLGIASSSASSDVKTVNAKRQLTKWQDDLTSEQVSRILSVVQTYGLDLYKKNPEPDYARLNALQDQTFAWST
jgi:hypothetical protein